MKRVSREPLINSHMAAPMMNPATYTGWMMAPMDPRMMNMGMQMANPATSMQWMAIPMDPKVMGLMAAPINPQVYGNWMGVVADPRTYPMMQQVQMPAAGAASAPSTTPAKY